ncbi:MAG: hypothetical protein ABJP45_09615 [Cyclobacteriaceae bacterium]
MNNKIAWALIDLLMIIVGVYCAFLIQKYAETEQTKKDEERVLSALKIELEEFRISLPQFAAFMDKYLARVKDNPSTNFSGWRYSEPQYSYKIIEYAMNLDNSAIVDFALYDKLQKLFVVIKQLEHSERSMTRISEKYRPIVSSLGNNHIVNQERAADNAGNFHWFRTYSNDRSGSLKRVGQASTEALDVINDRLGQEKRREIERKFILTHSSRVSNAEEAIALVKQFFPDFTEEEVRKLYQKSKEK